MTKRLIKKAIIFVFPCEENEYKPQVLSGNLLFYLAIGFLALKIIGISLFVFIPKTSYFADISKGTLIQMTNEERGRMGLCPLSEDPQLTIAAEMKANDMLQRGYFAHWSPDGVSPWYWFGQSGYNYQYAGENLAIGFLDAKDVHREWLASPDHRSNILGANYRDIGIAIKEGDFYGQKTYLVVQVFGSKNNIVTTKPLEESPLITEEPSLIVKEETVEVTLPIIEEKTEVITEEVPVLGVETEISSAQEMENSPIKQSLVNFFAISYDGLIKKIMLYTMILLGLVLIINALANIEVQQPTLIFKGLAFLIIFFVFDYMDQATLIKIFSELPQIR